MGLIHRLEESEGGATRAPYRWRGSSWVALLAVLGGGAANAGTRAGHDVDLSVASRAGRFEVRGSFSTAASRAIVWQVLTDYDGIPAFVPSIKQSSLERRDGDTLRVRQLAVMGTFALRRTAWVTLAVIEEPQRRIEFRDVLGRDFRYYAGSWSLQTNSTLTVVSYALDVMPRAGLPAWVGRSIASHSAGDMLEQVRDEIERRSAGR